MGEQVHKGDEFMFSFQDKHTDSIGQTNSSHPSVPIEQMTPQYIQQEIANGLKIDRSQVTRDNIPPPIDYLDDTFQEFTENKAYSFLMLTYHPYFKNKFDQDDITVINKATKNRGQAVSIFKISSIIGIYAGCEHLFKTRPIFGLTTNTGFAALIFRYYLVPKLLTSVVDSCIFYPQLQRKTSQVLKKYNFDTEMKQNPLYKQAFQDFKTYQNNLQIQRQQKQKN